MHTSSENLYIYIYIYIYILICCYYSGCAIMQLPEFILYVSGCAKDLIKKLSWQAGCEENLDVQDVERGNAVEVVERL